MFKSITWYWCLFTSHRKLYILHLKIIYSKRCYRTMKGNYKIIIIARNCANLWHGFSCTNIIFYSDNVYLNSSTLSSHVSKFIPYRVDVCFWNVLFFFFLYSVASCIHDITKQKYTNFTQHVIRHGTLVLVWAVSDTTPGTRSCRRSGLQRRRRRRSDRLRRFHMRRSRFSLSSRILIIFLRSYLCFYSINLCSYVFSFDVTREVYNEF